MEKHITSWPRRPGKATAAQLAQAHAAARLHGTLNAALQSPLLARCLELTAEALTSDTPNEFRPPPPAPAPGPDLPAPPQTHAPNTPQRRDVKRASAGDTDD